MDNFNSSDKKRLIALLLCFFLGWLGAHRFYTNKIMTAILMILTLGGLGIWAFVDFIFIACGQFKDKNEKILTEWL